MAPINLKHLQLQANPISEDLTTPNSSCSPHTSRWKYAAAGGFHSSLTLFERLGCETMLSQRCGLAHRDTNSRLQQAQERQKPLFRAFWLGVGMERRRSRPGPEDLRKDFKGQHWSLQSFTISLILKIRRDLSRSSATQTPLHPMIPTHLTQYVLVRT